MTETKAMEEANAQCVRLWQDESRVPYHVNQFAEPYRSTVHLAQFIRSVAPNLKGDALDVGCGAGANIYHLSRMLSGHRWIGVDISGDLLFPIGHKKFTERRLEITLVQGDFYSLTELFPNRQFDLVLSIQILLGLPHYAAALDQLLAVTRGWLFITSLFTDFEVEAKVEAMDYSRLAHCQGPFYYNVYNLARFRAYCEAHGCRQFVTQDFEIDRDLPPPPSNGLGSYTRSLADGRRILCSGPLLMPWKMVGIRMGDG